MRVSLTIVSFSLVCVLLLGAGCASIVSKSTYSVSISSQPDQADILIRDEEGKIVHRGQTPTTVPLNTKRGYFKGKNYSVTFTKEGYGKQTAQIRRGVDGWYIGGNFLFGGLIGWLIVDPLTGAMWTLPGDMMVTLSPLTSSLMTEETGLSIVLLDNIPQHLRQKMVRID